MIETNSIVQEFKNGKSIRIETSRFIWFMLNVESPITEEKIISYYEESVAGFGRANMAIGCIPESKSKTIEWDGRRRYYNGEIEIPKDDSLLRQYALKWFDSNLGRAIRKNISFKKEDYIRRGERLLLLEK